MLGKQSQRGEWFASFEAYAEARTAGLLQEAQRILRDQHLAEDAAIETLATVMKEWRRVSGSGNPHAYVRRILTNTCWQVLRAQGAERESPYDSSALPVMEAPDEFSAIEDRSDMDRLMIGLSSQQKFVVTLKYIYSMPYSEIAETMRIKESTARFHHFAAMQRLREVVSQRDLS